MRKAWTLAELTIAIIIILLLVALGSYIFKPNTQKSRIFMYAVLKNLNKGHSAIMEKYGNVALDGNEDDVDDWYCAHLAEMFTIKGVYKCEKTSNIQDVNIEFPNGVTLQGLANEWKTPYKDAPYTVKNIIVDIDGQKGSNKIWVDRFPLKVLKGDKYTGTIRVVDCSDDSVYNADDEKVTLEANTGLSPYCKNGFNVNGSAVTKGINKTIASGNIITYDVYRATSADGPSKATNVAISLSPMESDCASYGGDGAYNREACAVNQIKIAYKCATTKFCEKCNNTKAGISICPVDPDSNNTQTNPEGCKTVAEKYNPDNLPCFTLLHKPNAGMSFFVDSVIGEIDM